MDSNLAESSVEHSAGEDAAWAHVKRLLCQISVELPVPHFTVRKLLDLAPGVVLDTYMEEGSHLPVTVNGQRIAWGEFDVLDESLAIRLTEFV